VSKIVVLGDLHLDQSTAGVDRFADGSTVLERAVRHAQELKAMAFVFLGDLSDPHTSRSHRAVATLARAVADLKKAGTWSILLVGNHDVIEDGSGGCAGASSAWWLHVQPSFH
jgi:DNA repair exonuclease SbcCD nuclease subunit